MPGSMRRRGDSWELRVYAGTDPETGGLNVNGENSRTGTWRTCDSRIPSRITPWPAVPRTGDAPLAW
jgi:hypothetical protein